MELSGSLRCRLHKVPARWALPPAQPTCPAPRPSLHPWHLLRASASKCAGMNTFGVALSGQRSEAPRENVRPCPQGCPFLMDVSTCVKLKTQNGNEEARTPNSEFRLQNSEFSSVCSVSSVDRKRKTQNPRRKTLEQAGENACVTALGRQSRLSHWRSFVALVASVHLVVKKMPEVQFRLQNLPPCLCVLCVLCG